MIQINITGFKNIEIKKLVTDNNSKLANYRRKLIKEFNIPLYPLNIKLNIYDFSIYTFRDIKKNLAKINCLIKIFKAEVQKYQYIFIYKG